MKYILVILCLGFGGSWAENGLLDIQDHCSSTIHLSDHGQNSSISLALTPVSSSVKYTPCKIHLVAPNTHLLYIRVVDNDTELSSIEKNQIFEASSSQKTDEELFQKQLEDYVNGKSITEDPEDVTESEEGCQFSIFQPEVSGKPSFTSNPCSVNFNPEGGLLSHQADLQYTPTSRSSPRWVLVTAVGAGEICLNSRQHSCLQAGWTPLLCISKDLLCNGVVNCPTGGVLGDENPQFCKDRNSVSSSNWEKLANDFLKKFTGKSKTSGSLLPAIQKTEKKWTDTLNTSNTNTIATSNVTSSIAQYGPWGYLMLGLLICGTVLTFCGLWECCCRRSKSLQPPPGGSASSSVTSGAAASTAVLVSTAGPPKYEELDQPPSYTVLFPEKQ